MDTPKKDSYHHGNLKQTLLDVAFESLHQQSHEQLSLRQLAKTVGVTPTAVYNHFSDKVALLMETKLKAFEFFHQVLSDDCRDMPPDATEARLRRLGKSYLNFSIEYPYLFELLFSWNVDPEKIPPHLTEAGVESERLIQEVVKQLLRENGRELSEYESAIGSFVSWALAHGVCTLFQAGAVRAAAHINTWPAEVNLDDPIKRDAIIDQVIEVLIAGLKSRFL
ncbi:TetR/AcrR family transcriptional regulator [Gynuella sp.]|uniref:TetR/AcrR family transcriptional regulator n=1 Tax=Gynuella sp. TaxID=2969146 RepID=UPI003D0F3736